jgi:nucleotide-binding universal stress UspA family protein
MVANALTARLVVLHVPAAMNPPVGLILGPKSLIVGAQQSALQIAQAEVEQKEAFAEMASRSGISWIWQDLEDPVTSRVARHARHADLVLLFRTGQTTSIVSAAGVVLESGRPTMVLPPDQGPLPLPFHRIVVAWNGSREASRAVHDAMPFLKQADQVIIATAAESSLFKEEQEPGPDVCDHLANHGVRCEFQRLTAIGPEPGEELLSFAAEAAADLIVAGCYGHMRLTEFIFGGVSRTLLARAMTPILMSF